MCSFLLINVSADSVGVLWKSGCFHFLMKGKYYISYSNLLPMRFCFKLFLEGWCSSLSHREMHNTEIYVCWTMLDWPWKNGCTAGIVSDKCRWRNREPGSTESAYNLPGCVSVWRRRGLVLRKANLSFLWLHINAIMLCFSPWRLHRSVSDSLHMKSTQLPVLFSLAVLQHTLLFLPSVTLWGAAHLSCTPTHFKSAFPPWAPTQVLKPHITFHSLIAYSISESLKSIYGPKVECRTEIECGLQYLTLNLLVPVWVV